MNDFLFARLKTRTENVDHGIYPELKIVNILKTEISVQLFERIYVTINHKKDCFFPSLSAFFHIVSLAKHSQPPSAQLSSFR